MTTVETEIEHSNRAGMRVAEVPLNSTGGERAVQAASGYHFGAVVPFALLHVAALGVLFVPFSWSLVAWFVGSYLLRMFGVTGGYHRYFSHRSYRLNRGRQFRWPSWPRPRHRKGRCGGRRSTAIIIATPTESRMSTRRGSVASGGRTWVGFCRTITTIRPEDGRGHRSLSGASLAGPVSLAAGRRSRSHTLGRRRGGVSVGLCAVNRGALSLDVRDQLTRPPVGTRRFETRDTAATTGFSPSSRWARAGTTTTTSRWQLPAGIPLVGDRHHLCRAKLFGLCWNRARSAPVPRAERGCANGTGA